MRRWAKAVSVALGVSMGTAACTKVREQPPAPVVESAPGSLAAKTVSPRQRPAPRPAFGAALPAPASSGAVAARPATSPDTAPAPAGRPLDQAAVNKAVQVATPAMAACLNEGAGSHNVQVSFDADPSGRPRNVKLTGAPPEAERCLVGQVSVLRFPEFDGPAVAISFPLTTYRPPPAPPAPSAPPPPAPKVFVNP